MLQVFWCFLVNDWFFFCFSQLATVQAQIRIWSGDVNEVVIVILLYFYVNKMKENLIPCQHWWGGRGGGGSGMKDAILIRFGIFKL